MTATTVTDKLPDETAVKIQKEASGDEGTTFSRQDPMDKIFIPICAVITMLVTPQLVLMYGIGQMLHAQVGQHDNPNLTDISQLWQAFVYAAGMFALKISLDKLLYPWFYKTNKIQNDEELRQRKAHKQTYFLYKTIFYAVMLPYELYYFPGERWWPMFLGGPCGAYQTCYFRNANETAFQHIDIPLIKQFYLCQMGFRIQDLVSHLFFKEDKNNDHWTMMAHHICALSCILASWLGNILPIGALIMFLHDASDILSSPIRVWSDTKWSDSLWIGVAYVLYLFTWVWSRNIAYPWLCYKYIMFVKTGGPDYPYAQLTTYVNGTFISVLALCHYVWSVPIFKIFYKFVKTGKGEDLQNHVVTKKPKCN